MATMYRRSPQRVLWGPDVLEYVAGELARASAARPLLVCGASVESHPHLLPRLVDALGGTVAGVFAGVHSHTPKASVEVACAALDESGADSVIAVGGGSAIVTARATCILHGERRPIEDLATRVSADGAVVSPRLRRPKLPIIAIPTTPTTAVGKAGTAVTAPGRHGRLAMFDPATRAQSILLDPEYLASSPDSLVRNAALNAFVMAVDGLATGRSHVFSDALLVYSLTQFTELLPHLADGIATPGLRLDAALVSILVGDGTDTTGGGLTAALSHTIGHHYDAHNGVIDVIVLPHVLERMPPEPLALGRIAAGLACAPERTGARLREILTPFGGCRRLRGLGVQLDDLLGLAEEARSDFAFQRLAHQVETNDLVDILRSAW